MLQGSLQARPALNGGAELRAASFPTLVWLRCVGPSNARTFTAVPPGGARIIFIACAASARRAGLRWGCSAVVPHAVCARGEPSALCASGRGRCRGSVELGTAEKPFVGVPGPDLAQPDEVSLGCFWFLAQNSCPVVNKARQPPLAKEGFVLLWTIPCCGCGYLKPSAKGRAGRWSPGAELRNCRTRGNIFAMLSDEHME